MLHVILKTIVKPIRTKESLKSLQDHFICRPEPLSTNLCVQQSQITKLFDQFIQILCPEIRIFLSELDLLRLRPSGPGAGERRQSQEESRGLPFDEELKRLLPNLDAAPNLKVANLLKGRGPKVLCDPSNYERTKLLFEALCEHWGFYFRVTPSSNGIGAPDLQSFINTLPSFPNWKDDIFKENKDRSRDHISGGSDTNEFIGSLGLAKLFLARKLALRTFIEVSKEVNGGILNDHAKFDWLLFQILPSVRINDMDPFSALVDFCLEDVDYELLNFFHTQFSVPGAIFNNNRGFLYVLDEAQDAESRYMGAFSDYDGYAPLPLLHPLARYLTNSYFFTTIIAGSEISSKSLSYVGPSEVACTPFWSWVSAKEISSLP